MRDNWNLYDKLIQADGETIRDRSITRAKRDYQVTSRGSLSRKHVLINEEERDVLIISGKSMHVKTILSMPDEQFYDGDYVFWEDCYWLISETDSENTVQYRGTIRQCNRLLKWQNEDGDIIERWCATDEKATNTQGISYSEIIDKVKTNYTLYLPLDKDTMKIRRYQRFIMDVDLDDPDTYVVTNRNVISSVYDPEQKHGVITIVLSQDERSQDHDNLDLQVADYKEEKEIIKGINCEIKYTGDSPSIKAGGSYKTYTAYFYNASGDILDSIVPVWDVTIMPEMESYFDIKETDGKLLIKASYEPSIIHSQVKIDLRSSDGSASCTTYAKVVYVI